MNFTNSPYEHMKKEIPHKAAPTPQKAPEVGELFYSNACSFHSVQARVVFSAIGNTLKSRADV